MPITHILLYSFTAFYIFAVILLIAGSFRLGHPGKPTDLPSVSVVVAARNEEAGLGACLEALASQEYPRDRYQVTVINDRSEDRTGEIAAEFCGRYPFFQCITVSDTDPGMPAKKRALTMGIEQSSGDIVLTTDADCVPAPGWAAAMAGSFRESTGMVAGYSILVGARCIIPRFAALHAYAMELVNAGVIGLGGALSCTGRSLAYRKKVFEEVNGFEAVKQSVSGDDDLLLQLVHTRTAWHIRYCTDRSAHVTSFAPPDTRTFARQQTRHISASRYYPRRILLLGGAVYAYFLLLTAAGAGALAGVLPWQPVALSLACKFLSEAAAMVRARRLFGSSGQVLLLLPGSILFIFHILIFSVTGMGGKFSWK